MPCGTLSSLKMVPLLSTTYCTCPSGLKYEIKVAIKRSLTSTRTLYECILSLCSDPSLESFIKFESDLDPTSLLVQLYTLSRNKSSIQTNNRAAEAESSFLQAKLHVYHRLLIWSALRDCKAIMLMIMMHKCRSPTRLSMQVYILKHRVRSNVPSEESITILREKDKRNVSGNHLSCTSCAAILGLLQDPSLALHRQQDQHK